MALCLCRSAFSFVSLTGAGVGGMCVPKEPAPQAAARSVGRNEVSLQTGAATVRATSPPISPGRTCMCMSYLPARAAGKCPICLAGQLEKATTGAAHPPTAVSKAKHNDTCTDVIVRLVSRHCFPCAHIPGTERCRQRSLR